MARPASTSVRWQVEASLAIVGVTAMLAFFYYAFLLQPPRLPNIHNCIVNGIMPECQAVYDSYFRTIAGKTQYSLEAAGAGVATAVIFVLAFKRGWTRGLVVMLPTALASWSGYSVLMADVHKGVMSSPWFSGTGWNIAYAGLVFGAFVVVLSRTRAPKSPSLGIRMPRPLRSLGILVALCSVTFWAFVSGVELVYFAQLRLISLNVASHLLTTRTLLNIAKYGSLSGLVLAGGCAALLLYELDGKSLLGAVRRTVLVFSAIVFAFTLGILALDVRELGIQAVNMLASLKVGEVFLVSNVSLLAASSALLLKLRWK